MILKSKICYCSLHDLADLLYLRRHKSSSFTAKLRNLLYLQCNNLASWKTTEPNNEVFFLWRPQKGKTHLQQLAVAGDHSTVKKKQVKGARKTQNEDGDCTWSFNAHRHTHSSPLSAGHTSVALEGSVSLSVIKITSVAFSCTETVARKGAVLRGFSLEDSIHYS